MALRILTDFHHSSLLRSLYLLFEDRLDYKVYRPIGIQWFVEGYWAINNQYDTAKQFLSLKQAPVDNTPPLNEPDSRRENSKNGVYYCLDPGGRSVNRAITLEFFKKNRFDILIASIPQHIGPFKRLISQYQPHAKLIVQMGNEWPEEYWTGNNVLASVKPREVENCNAMFYHQEFNLKEFAPTKAKPTKKIFSFVNVLQNMPQAHQDFYELKRRLNPHGYHFSSFGGQNEDGNMDGPQKLANKMREAQFIMHVKDGGDGFGHIIYNAYAVGRPVIIRPSQYKDRLAEELFADGGFINLDLDYDSAVADILAADELQTEIMGSLNQQRFKQVVDYNKEAQEVETWLANLGVLNVRF